MNNPSEDYLCGLGDFSHVHQYFGLQKKCKKYVNKFVWTTKHYLHDYYLHL
jgi:hypothetical protein